MGPTAFSVKCRGIDFFFFFNFLYAIKRLISEQIINSNYEN